MDARSVALALGGEATGNTVLAPGPGHSRRDRSLSLRLDPSAPDGFICHSFAGDDPLACRDHVRAACGLPAFSPRIEAGAKRRLADEYDAAQERGDLQRRGGDGTSKAEVPTASDIGISHKDIHDARAFRDAEEAEPGIVRRIAAGMSIWRAAGNVAGTVADGYLQSRGLAVFNFADFPDLRYHGGLHHDGAKVPGLVALMRDAVTNEPTGVHRTFLDSQGCKLGRKMLGRARGAVVKLTPDEEVTGGLGIAEGLEDALAVLLAGWSPVWACLSAGAIARFPVLPAVEALTIFADADEPGQAAARRCVDAWQSAGREARISRLMDPQT